LCTQGPLKQFFEKSAKVPTERRTQQELLALKDENPKWAKAYMLAESWYFLSVIACMFMIWNGMDGRRFHYPIRGTSQLPNLNISRFELFVGQWLSF
jgi:hypothetical protein